jgi:hypothetical protein
VYVTTFQLAIYVASVAGNVSAIDVFHPPNVYQVFVGLFGLLTVAPYFPLIAFIVVPPFVLKLNVIVFLAYLYVTLALPSHLIVISWTAGLVNHA